MCVLADFILYLSLFFCSSPRAMLFSSDAGSWAETMPSSECVSCVCTCVWVCAFHCLWGHEIAPKPEGPWCTGLPSLPLCSTLSPSIVITLCGVFVSIMNACMYDSSQLVAHPSVPTTTFIPASKPSVHQSLSPSVLLRRETDTQRR